MQAVHNHLTLDVNTAQSTAIIVAKAEDVGSRFIDIELLCAGNKIIVDSNDRAVLMALDTATGSTIAAVDCQITSGMIVAELTDQLLAIPGDLICEIVIYGTNNAVLTTPDFGVHITQRIDSTVVERDDDFSALVSALEDVATTSNRINSLADTVNSRVQPVSLGGTGAADTAAAAQSLKVPYLAQGSAIAEYDDLDDYSDPGTYNAVSTVAATLSHCPITVGFKLIVLEQHNGYRMQIILSTVGQALWYRGSTTANTYSQWHLLSTRDDLINQTIYRYGTAEAGADYNDLTSTGLYAVCGSAASPTSHSPNNNDSNNAFHVLVFCQGSDITQLAVNMDTDSGVYVRNYRDSTWGGWKRLLNTDSLTFESGTWQPATTDGTIIVHSARYVYDGYRMTITARISCSTGIDTALTITGLPMAAAYDCAGVCGIVGSSQSANVIISDATMTIRSSDTLYGATIVITATYIV